MGQRGRFRFRAQIADRGQAGLGLVSKTEPNFRVGGICGQEQDLSSRQALSKHRRGGNAPHREREKRHHAARDHGPPRHGGKRVGVGQQSLQQERDSQRQQHLPEDEREWGNPLVHALPVQRDLNEGGGGEDLEETILVEQIQRDAGGLGPGGGQRETGGEKQEVAGCEEGEAGRERGPVEARHARDLAFEPAESALG